MRPRGKSRTRALTLLEVVVALSVFVVLLLGLASGLTSAMALDTLTRERLAASLRATSVMEEVAAAPWDQLPASDGMTFDVMLDAEGGTYALPPGGGRFEPGLVRVQDLGQPDLRSVTVSVVFRSRGTGSDATVALRCLVAKH